MLCINLIKWMQLGTKQEFQLSSPLIAIRPLRYSPVKIIAVAAGIVTVGVLLALLSYRLAILELLLVGFALFYLKITNQPYFLWFFFAVQEEDEQDINKYAINDLSYRKQPDQCREMRKTGHVFIVHVHYVKEGIKYFHFKEELYKIEAGVAASIKESDILKVLEIRDFKEYLRYGLSGDTAKTSLQLFKKQTKFLHPNSWHFISKRICEEIELSLLNLLILCVACLVIQSILLSIVLAMINGVIFGLMVFDEVMKVDKFQRRFQPITSQKFFAYRQGQTQKVAFSDILVGDIIEIERTGPSDEYMTNFQSLLIANFEVVCKQGVSRHESYKSPVKEIGDVQENRKMRFVIHPMSYIEKATLRGNENLMVMENSSISKFFSLWFQKWRYAEYYPLQREKIAKACKLFAYGVCLLLALYVIFVIIHHSPLLPSSQEMSYAILASTLLVPACIHLLFCISHHRGMSQLQQLKIEPLGANLTEAGSISNIVINFSELLELQFREILYKNMIFDPSSRPFEPDSNMLENGRTYESLLAIILYISMGYFDQEENKSTFLRVIFKLFEEYFQYQETLEGAIITVHRPTHRVWRLIHKDLQNEKGVRSWRLFYQEQLKYVLTQFNIQIESNNFLESIGTEDQNRMAIYTSLAESLIEEGKKVKGLLFKSFKKETISARESEILEHTAQQFKQIDRKVLQKNMEFAAFIVFDNALKVENQKIIELLRNLRNSDNSRIFNLVIYSHNQNQNLAGFEHILQSIPIHYSFKAHEKASLIRERMQQCGTLVVGNDFDDIYGELVSDLTIRIDTPFQEENKLEKIILPSDFCIEKLEDLKEILSVGMNHAHFKIQVIKYSFIVWFWMTFGWVYIEAQGKIKLSELWAIILPILLIFLPLMAKCLLNNSENFKNYKRYLETLTFPFASQLAISFFVASVIIGVGFNEFCQVQVKISEAHMLTLRQGHHEAIQNYNCLNLPLLLSGSASVVTFAIFFGQQGCILNQFQWWRFLLAIIWLAMMLITAIPIKPFLLSIGIVVFLASLKFLIKLIGPSPPQKGLKQSQNAETEIQ